MELLAPAGDIKSFYAAIYNGADAVYLGLQNFNARIKADNFTADNLADLVAWAHLYHVKVYVTINILISDDEVDDFLATVRACVRAHVDAYIVQDFGMAQLLQRTFPGIVLHASTQMGIHNLSGAKVLEKLGFKRVVLARETKLDDIKLIRQHTKLEIEYFVQGALCVAFSGNCYLSSIKNGNSGNRGKCLQLCRLPYQVYAGEKLLNAGYFLSAKDLCLMQRLPELIAAGVDCLKIEGRLKRASYVAQVVRSYRQALDDWAGTDVAAEQRKISTLFARGAFNENAYLHHNFAIINPQVGHHQGKKIGMVVDTVRFKNIFKITLQIDAPIGQNDAIRLVQGNRQFSIGVGNVNQLSNGCVDIFSKQNVPAGAEVYLLKSAAKEKVLADFVRYLPIDFYFTGRIGAPAQLVANHGAVSVMVKSEQPLAAARTAGLTTAQVQKQLSKLNDTPFRLHHLEINLDAVFMAVSALNDLRRKAVIALKQAVLDQYHAGLPAISETKCDQLPVLNTPPQNFYLVSDVRDLQQVDWHDYGVIICPREYSLATVERLVSAVVALGVERKLIYLNLPVVATEAEMELLDHILSAQKMGIVANNYAHLRWVQQYPTVAGTGLNVYNQYTAAALIKLGCQNIIWSIEKTPTCACGSALVSGYPALMTLCHCPVQTVYGSDCTQCHYHNNLIYQDEKQNRYRFRRVKISHCYFELYSEERYEKATPTGKIYDLRSTPWKSMK
ncbi:MAG: U32 family peptidase [Clostridia bacterium]|nr:U32 family peptidase [Clostridia bacterium]